MSANSTTRYRLGEQIGKQYVVGMVRTGGMGEVYMCLDTNQMLPIALKTVRLAYRASSQIRRRFENEIESWIALEKHPHIVHCRGATVLDSQLFILLEWIAGNSDYGVDLRQRLQHGNLDAQQALLWAIDVCRGLSFAQQRQPGIVHRDVKPENILITYDDVAKITDFGLATLVQDKLDSSDATDSLATTSDRQQTVNYGNVVGTPPYMAPEQWESKNLNERTDVYAVGCILFEMFSGRPPYVANTLFEYRQLHLQSTIPKVKANVSADLQAVINRCLDKDPQERPSFEVLHEQLSRVYQAGYHELPRTVGEPGVFGAVDYHNRGLAYYHLKRHDQAIADFDEVLRRDPTLTQTYVNRGNALDRAGRFEEAITDYSKALQTDLSPKERSIIYSNRGDSYANLKRYEEALGDLNEAVRLDPKHAMAFNNRGNVYHQLERYEDALKDFAKAIELDETLYYPYGNRASVYITLERYSEALVDLNRALDLDPLQVKGYVLRARILGQFGYLDEARKDIEKAIEIDPDNSEAYYQLAQIYASRLDQIGAALENYALALERDPADPNILNDRGVVLTQLKRYDEALHDLQNAYALMPEDAEIAFNLGAILAIIEFNRFADIPGSTSSHTTQITTSNSEQMRLVAQNLTQARKLFVQASKLGEVKAVKWAERATEYLYAAGVYFNNAGHISRINGQLEAAVSFQELAVTIAREIEDGEGVIIALENKYLSLRDGQQYVAALQVLEDIVAASKTYNQAGRHGQYLREISQALNRIAAEKPDCIVRRAQLATDMSICVSQHGKSARTLVVEESEVVLEVLGSVPLEMRRSFRARLGI